jgi:hypothetical protein
MSMTEEELKDLGALIAELPARPQSYSYEGQVRPTAKSTGYADYHVQSICGDDPNEPDPEENHHCIGNVIAKDEDTAARLARLIEVAPVLLDEVIRLRAALTNLADADNANKRIAEAEECGGDGIHCAVREVQHFAQGILGLGMGDV